ncbi:hypothetical protein [Marinoscillum sp. MHG1-6]|uniref:hypothetical protein n=1 Tax=Marinoscillum sp. MHG1-6 TaxID=2959627 RepID=UPI0021572A5A|nr:hypothetical protein [Marinoscillum sp. MHG1-6]
MAKTASEVFEEAKAELGGLKAISAVEIASGLSHGSLVVDTKFDLDAASAYNAEVIKAKIKAKNAMGMQKEKIDIMIIELTSQIHVIQPTDNEKFIIYMAADKSASNMGLIRKVMLGIAKDVQSTLD